MPVIEAKLGNHGRLGLVLGSDNLNHPVKIKVCNQISVEQFDPIIDLAEPMPGALDQHFDLVTDPAGQHVLERQDPRCPIGIEHVQVQRDSHLELG